MEIYHYIRTQVPYKTYLSSGLVEKRKSKKGLENQKEA